LLEEFENEILKIKKIGTVKQEKFNNLNIFILETVVDQIKNLKIKNNSLKNEFNNTTNNLKNEIIYFISSVKNQNYNLKYEIIF
jgi:hypothetical protein